MLGQQIGHYRVIRQLGAGGMGVVYEAEDTRLGRHVALKFLPEVLNVSTEAADRFEREARIASSINHPNICTIHDIGVHDGRRFIVMELLDGESLRQKIQGTPLAADLVIDIGCQIADALDAAHVKGIVHRDVKPANILLTKRGPAKLLDFGIAKLGHDDRGGASDATHMSSDALTMPGTAVGSVNYMSPEQARGEAIDGRTDLFSLGLVIYEMATGRQAFGGQTTAVVFDAILNRDPAPAQQFNLGLPDELARVINRALEKDRKLRYQTAADMAAELSRIRRDSSGRTVAATAATAVGPMPISASPTPAPPIVPAAASAPSASTIVTTTPAASERKSWLRPAVLGVPIVLIAAVAAFWLWTTTRTPAFTERDPIVIADFTNTTGDTVFDDALKQAVSVQLQQTPYVTLIGEPQVQRTLKLMQRKPDQPVTGAVAREVCQRSGGKATVDGSIAPLGSSYVIALAVHSCQSGETIAQQQVQAASKEGVLKAVGDVVTELRKHLGESLASVAKYDVPAEATTSSLEALQAYGQANKIRTTKGDEAALPFFQHAIESDPNFALAYAKLSVVSSNLNKNDDAATYGRKAYDLRDRVSEYERLYITWNYASHVTNDDKLTLDTLELLTTSYPRDFSARNNLGVFYNAKNRYEEAVKQYAIASDIQPNDPLPYANEAHSLFSLGRTADGIAMATKSLALRPDGGLSITRWQAARIIGDAHTAQYEADARKQAPEGQFLSTLSDFALWNGRLKEYRTITSDSIQKGRAAGQNDVVLNGEFQMAVADAALAQPPHVTALKKYLTSAPYPQISATAAEVLGLVGDIDDVRAAAPHMPKASRDASVVVPLTSAQAAVLSADKKYDEATALIAAAQHEFPGNKDLNLQLGMIREAAGDMDGAITRYRAVVDAQASLGTNMMLPMARLKLGEALMRRGDTTGAREQFDILAKQWAAADPDFALARTLAADRAQLKK